MCVLLSVAFLFPLCCLEPHTPQVVVVEVSATGAQHTHGSEPCSALGASRDASGSSADRFLSRTSAELMNQTMIDEPPVAELPSPRIAVDAESAHLVIGTTPALEPPPPQSVA